MYTPYQPEIEKQFGLCISHGVWWQVLTTLFVNIVRANRSVGQQQNASSTDIHLISQTMPPLSHCPSNEPTVRLSELRNPYARSARADGISAFSRFVLAGQTVTIITQQPVGRVQKVAPFKWESRHRMIPFRECGEFLPEAPFSFRIETGW